MSTELSGIGPRRRSCGGGRGQGGRGGGLLEPTLLAVLASQPCHGYELRRAVEELSGGFVCIDPGGMYRVLRRLEEEGFVASAWSEGDHGPQRRRYELTDEGRSLLKQWAEHLRQRERVFRSVIEIVERSLGPVTTERSSKQGEV